MLINDRAADAAVAANFYVVQQNTVFDAGPGMNVAARADDAALDGSARNNGSRGHQGIVGNRFAASAVANGFGRRAGLRTAANRPLIVV